MNTLYFERLNEHSRLAVLSKGDLKIILLHECSQICPAHTPKHILVDAILEFKFGKEINNEEEPKTP